MIYDLGEDNENFSHVFVLLLNIMSFSFFWGEGGAADAREGRCIIAALLMAPTKLKALRIPFPSKIVPSKEPGSQEQNTVKEGTNLKKHTKSMSKILQKILHNGLEAKLAALNGKDNRKGY